MPGGAKLISAGLRDPVVFRSISCSGCGGGVGVGVGVGMGWRGVGWGVGKGEGKRGGVINPILPSRA